MTAKLLAAFTFCSTFALRPIGGFIIGWIGDQIGRKSTIVITTSIMANVGTYAEIGITASAMIITCRVLQGISSLGEIVGANLYITETLKQPHKYICNALISTGANFGGLFALIVASFALSVDFNWRIAFWIGTAIAIIGLAARIRLRETPEFVDLKMRMKIKAEISKQNLNIAKYFEMHEEKVDKKAVLAYFLIRLIWPVCFYVTYIYGRRDETIFRHDY